MDFNQCNRLLKKIDLGDAGPKNIPTPEMKLLLDFLVEFHAFTKEQNLSPMDSWVNKYILRVRDILQGREM